MCTICLFVFLNKRTDQTSLNSRSHIETLNPLVSFLSQHRKTQLGNQAALVFDLLSARRLVAADRTAAKSSRVEPTHVSAATPLTLLRTGTVFSASFAVSLLVRSHRQVPGPSAAISATEGPRCHPAGSETPELARLPEHHLGPQPGSLPAQAGAEEECSGVKNSSMEDAGKARQGKARQARFCREDVCGGGKGREKKKNNKLRR